jgi:uncharacterized protein
MIKLGEYAILEVVKTMSFGAYLDAGPFGEVLLPKRYVPQGLEPGHDLKVFLYCDSEDRVIATTEIPFAQVGDIVGMTVKDLAPNGAFLDWGLMKDLFVPFREQEEKMEVGKTYIVKVLLDEATDRIYASSKIGKYLIDKNDGQLNAGDEVKLLVWQRTDLGYKMIINNQYIGLIFKNEIFQPIKIGQILRGYVKLIREDEKIDITLQKQGYQNQIPDASDLILKKMKENGGFLPITDSSDPVLIYDTLGISKKAFKKAVGNLYKQRLVLIEETGIKLV